MGHASAKQHQIKICQKKFLIKQIISSHPLPIFKRRMQASLVWSIMAVMFIAYAVQKAAPHAVDEVTITITQSSNIVNVICDCLDPQLNCFAAL